MNFDDIVKTLDKVPEKIRWAIVAVICAMILVGYYIVFRIPAEKELEILMAQKAQLEREYSEKQAIADDLKNWQDQVRQLETQLTEALKQLPEKVGYETLLVSVPNIAKKNNLDVLSMELMPEVPSTDYIEVPIELKLNGEFPNFTHFMQEIGEHPRIMKVQSFMIKRDTKTKSEAIKKNNVSVIAEMITYRFKSSADAPAEPVKKTGMGMGMQ